MKKRHMMAGLLVLLLVIAITAVACGGGTATTTTAASSGTTAASTQATAASTETTTAPSTDTTGATPTSAATGPATGKPILVGFSNSLTGPAAAPGGSVQTGVDLQVEIINNQGGINGRPLKILMADDKSDAQTILANMTKMIEQDKVDALIGPVASDSTDAVRVLVEQARIPTVANGPDTAAWINDPTKQMKWSVAFAASAPAQAAALQVLITKNGWKNILAMNDVLKIHQDTLALLKEGAAAGGYQITISPDVPGFDVTDYAPFTNKLKAQYDKLKPDAIFLYTNAFAAAPIYKSLRALGVTVPIQVSPASAHPAIFAMGPEAVEGLMVLSVGGLANPAAMPDTWPLKAMQIEFGKAYQAKYNAAPDYFAYDGASVVMTLAEAMKRAGGAEDKAKVAEALVNMSGFQTYEGIVQYSPTDTGQAIDTGMVDFTIKGGQFADPQVLTQPGS